MAALQLLPGKTRGKRVVMLADGTRIGAKVLARGGYSLALLGEDGFVYLFTVDPARVVVERAYNTAPPELRVHLPRLEWLGTWRLRDADLPAPHTAQERAQQARRRSYMEAGGEGEERWIFHVYRMPRYRKVPWGQPWTAWVVALRRRVGRLQVDAQPARDWEAREALPDTVADAIRHLRAVAFAMAPDVEGVRWWFEFPRFNLAVDDAGNLVLLDVLTRTGAAPTRVGTPIGEGLLNRRRAPRGRGLVGEPWFHATTFDRLAGIATRGLDPGRGGERWTHGGYGARSRGKVFLARGEAAAREWLGGVETMAEDRHGDDQAPDRLVAVLLRVGLPTGARPRVDVVAAQEGKSESFYVTRVVPPATLDVWDPQRGVWVPLRDARLDVEDGVKEIERYEDGSVGIFTVDAYDDGGFKPDAGSPAWRARR